MGVKDSLKEYREKRTLENSPEPAGKGKRKKPRKPIFVIQKHDASSLHYDFRLEVDGVLKSWAIPKGPSTDPREKRLAARTEDHPLEYADFEGVIPEGQYGAGTVLVWDTGTYRNLREEKKDDGTSMEDSLEDGKVEVWLEGKKLKGGYVLIHAKQGGKKNWLFKKMKDDEADARRNPVSTQPKSVLSGKTLKEIARAIEKLEKKQSRGKDDS
jgi:DNA ligase D-like protein (predicted 3'-phosphoesterase)